MTEYAQQTPERALKNLKDVLSAYKYMQITEINNFLVTQSNRVGNMFDTMETYLAGITVPNPNPGPNGPANLNPYVSIPLRTAWNEFIKGRTTTAATKAVTYMDEWLGYLQNGYATTYQRTAAAQAAANGNNDLMAIITSIDALAQAIGQRTAWNNPFP